MVVLLGVLTLQKLVVDLDNGRLVLFWLVYNAFILNLGFLIAYRKPVCLWRAGLSRLLLIQLLGAETRHGLLKAVYLVNALDNIEVAALRKRRPEFTQARVHGVLCLRDEINKLAVEVGDVGNYVVSADNF